MGKGELRLRRVRPERCNVDERVETLAKTPAGASGDDNETFPREGREGGPQRFLRLARWGALLAVTLSIFRVSWVSDDALITLRHALNITHGWGPGYNATESVQAYTHPLWFLIWSGLGALTGEWIYSIVAFSILCAAGAVALVLWQARSTAVVLVAGGVFLLSNAFMEYATSGLENPLSFLLVGILVLAAVHNDKSTTEGVVRPVLPIAIFGASIALLALNRLDLLLLVAPLGAVWAWQRRRQWKDVLLAASVALVPLLAWFVWAQVTYGSFLPNTYEAKRNVNIPQSELVAQGLWYLWVSVRWDLVTVLGIAAGVGVTLWRGSALARAGAAGVLLYLVYVVSIGGDFMAGRFLSVPLYLSVLLGVLSTQDLFAYVRKGNVSKNRFVPALVGAVAIVLLLGPTLVGTSTSLSFDDTYRWNFRDGNGVADERIGYLEVNRGVWNSLMGRRLTPTSERPTSPEELDRLRELGVPVDDFLPGGSKADKGENPDPVDPLAIFGRLGDEPTLDELRDAARDYPRNPSGERLAIPETVLKTVELCGGLGSGGVMRGPTTHIVDTCALSDRFLASLPFIPPSVNRDNGINVRVYDPLSGSSSPIPESSISQPSRTWRIGHFNRDIPEGYIEAVRAGDPSLVVDKRLALQLADLWDTIR